MNKSQAILETQRRLAAIADLPAVAQMKCYRQHRHTSTYDHCFSVAVACCRIARTLHLPVNMNDLVMSAFLHDFYLYDCHLERRRHHLCKHPKWAAENARKHLGVSKEVQQAIRCHMWPLTLLHPPRNWIGWLVCLTDTAIALREFLQQ